MFFVLEGVFQRFQGGSFAELARMSAPSLRDLLNEEQFRAELPLFAGFGTLEAKASEAQGLIDDEITGGTARSSPSKAADESIFTFPFLREETGSKLRAGLHRIAWSD